MHRCISARNLVLHDELDRLWLAQRGYNDWLIGWTAVQSEESLHEPVRFQFVSGEHGAMTRGAIFLHIVNHATYHRGWVSDRSKQTADNRLVRVPGNRSVMRGTA